MSELHEDGFWGGQYYGPDDFTGYFTDFYTNGIKTDSTENLQVVANTNMTLEVKAGTAYIDGHFFKPKASKTITLPESDVQYPRIDVIVVRCDHINQKVKLDVIKGTAAEIPTIPELQRKNGIYDLGLAAVTVKPNTMSVSQENIKDLRFDNNYCGVVTGKVETISTTDLFAQYEAAWDAFIESLGESDKVDINTKDVQGRKLTEAIIAQQSFGSMFTMI